MTYTILHIIPTLAVRPNGDHLATEISHCPFCLTLNKLTEQGDPIQTCQHNAGLCKTEEPSIYFVCTLTV